MSKSNIKLVAVDLDNTLLREDFSISEYTKAVFEKIRERQIWIAFVTARGEISSRRFTEQIRPDVFVAKSGAIARVGKDIIYRAPMTAEDSAGLMDRFISEPGIEQIGLENEVNYYSCSPFDPDWGNYEDYKHAIVTDFTKPYDVGDVYKISVYAPDAEIPARIAEGFPDVNFISYRDENWHTFRSKKAAKEIGLMAVAQELGISLGSIVAFGDDTNDIGMLRAAGIGVAVSNALKEVKAAADEICADNNSDGVARWIEENLLR